MNLSNYCRKTPKHYIYCCLVGLHWFRMAELCYLGNKEKPGVLDFGRFTQNQTSVVFLKSTGQDPRETLLPRLFSGISDWNCLSGDCEGGFNLPGHLSSWEAALLAPARNLAKVLLPETGKQISLKNALLELACWKDSNLGQEIHEIISSSTAYCWKTYEKREYLLLQIEAERRLLQQFATGLGDLMHPLVLGQSSWLDMLLVLENKLSR